MTVSMRVLSAGDGDRSLSTPLTRCYTEEGTPPGLWIGSGLFCLGEVLSIETSNTARWWQLHE
ncbi:hypothetical protein DD236_10515 [Ancrocorticia populi]|uniref:Uncharacterized protein n=1 Tax=Ancrocorticia populi TaxID=2175228 RepID=A0A2V1JZT5_9ACTO|nr:hypothetical protein DD236_10515 [Ancrocorticia populi]